MVDVEAILSNLDHNHAPISLIYINICVLIYINIYKYFY